MCFLFESIANKGVVNTMYLFNFQISWFVRNLFWILFLLFLFQSCKARSLQVRTKLHLVNFLVVIFLLSNFFCLLFRSLAIRYLFVFFIFHWRKCSIVWEMSFSDGFWVLNDVLGLMIVLCYPVTWCDYWAHYELQSLVFFSRFFFFLCCVNFP